MACASSCKTKDHATYGECMRSKGIQVGDLLNGGVQKAGDKNLALYAQARKEGIQPKSTRMHDVQRAIAISDKEGKAYQA